MIRLYGRIRDRLDRQQLLAAVSLFGSSYNGSRPVFRLLFPRTKPVHRSVALEITLYRNLTTSALDVRRVAHRFLNKSRRVGAKLVARDNVKFYFSLLVVSLLEKKGSKHRSSKNTSFFCVSKIKSTARNKALYALYYLTRSPSKRLHSKF